eukprot:tig00000139_g8307.t1
MARARVRPSDPGVRDLRGAVNLEDLSNYNVTSGEVNMSKGQLFKYWLTQPICDGAGILPAALNMKCERFMRNIGRGIADAFPGVHAAVQETRRGGGRVGGYGDVADALETIFAAMDIGD